MFPDEFWGDFVDAADEGEDGGDGGVELGGGVGDDGGVEDGDEVLGVAFGVEGGEGGVVPEGGLLLAFAIFEIEVEQRVDEEVGGRGEGRVRDAAADKDLE